MRNQRVGAANGTTPQARACPADGGFTLVELLIVIVILGILATVTVFAVRGITDKGQENACSVELRTLVTAQESHYALHGGYADEATLVSSQTLSDESSMFEVTAAGGGYEIVPASSSSCTASSSESAGVADPGPDVALTSKTFHGFPAWHYGSVGADDEVVVFGGAAGAADWQAMVNAAPATSRRVSFVDLSSIDAEADVAHLMALPRTNGQTTFVLYTVDDVSSISRTGGGTWPTVDAYLSSAAAPDPYQRLNGSSGAMEQLLLALG
ncbi:MAG: prepilin-type N-terminal cleavage/methylation domain-containing protein [Ilumatobacteraceae bacterium]